MNKKEFLCNICNKKYASANSLCNHNKKYHQRIQTDFTHNYPQLSTKNPQLSTKNPQLSTKNPQLSTKNPQNSTNINLKKDIICKYCNKYLSRIDSLKRHEKICENKIDLENKNNELEILKNEINKLKLTLQKTLKIKAKKNIFNNCNNNNTINNNTINIVKFGSEKLQDIYTDKQMFNLINSGRLCIEKSIKYFAYPNGNYGLREIENLKKNGYTAAFSTIPDYLTKGNLDKTFQYPRFEILEDLTDVCLWRHYLNF
jgi:hypothetical protein